jgi:hypothetical protein
MTDGSRTRTWTRYSAERKAEAIALAASVGPTKAGEVLGIPGRSISEWMRQPTGSAVMAAAERAIADRLREAHAVALAEVLQGLRDPRARLGDKARALEVLGQQLALAEGRATSRTESMSLTADVTAGLDEGQRRDLRRTLDEALVARSLDAVRVDPLAVSKADLLALADALESRAGSGAATAPPDASALVSRVEGAGDD